MRAQGGRLHLRQSTQEKIAQAVQSRGDEATRKFAEQLADNCRGIIMETFENIAKEYPTHQQLKAFISAAPFTAQTINNAVVTEATNFESRTPQSQSERRNRAHVDFMNVFLRLNLL